MNIDLDDIKRVIAIEEKWDTEKIKNIEKEYLLFLENASNDNFYTPNQDIDKFWHWHILHTRKYREDCYKLFGKIIDHSPYYNAHGYEKCSPHNPSSPCIHSNRLPLPLP
jgi:hypothetical protein